MCACMYVCVSALDSAGVRYGDLLVGIGQDVCPDQASSASKVLMYACVYVCVCECPRQR